MKVRVTFKDPDVVGDAVKAAVKEQLAAIGGLDEDEREKLSEGRTEQIEEKLGRWITYGEYVTVEFDLEAMTASVVERAR